MKKIRLEFPLYWGESQNVYMPCPVYLKILDNQTKAFIDEEFTQSVPQTGKKISLEVELPEELEVIEVIPPGESTPVQNISLDWVWYGVDPNWKISGLQKVLVVLNGKSHEVPVFNEKPDFEEWKSFTSVEGEGRWWFIMPWALAIYITNTKTFGIFHWHSKLAKGL